MDPCYHVCPRAFKIIEMALIIITLGQIIKVKISYRTSTLLIIDCRTTSKYQRIYQTNRFHLIEHCHEPQLPVSSSRNEPSGCARKDTVLATFSKHSLLCTNNQRLITIFPRSFLLSQMLTTNQTLFNR